MNKILTVTALALVIAPFAIAQKETPNTKPANDPNKIVIKTKDPLAPAQLKKTLSLTDEQFNSVTGFYNVRMTKENKLTTDASISTQDKRSKRVEIKNVYIEDLKKVLTAEQIKKLDSLVKGEKDDNPGMHFTDAQRKALLAAKAKYDKKVDEIQKNPNLDIATKQQMLRDANKDLMLGLRNLLDPSTQSESIRAMDHVIEQGSPSEADKSKSGDDKNKKNADPNKPADPSKGGDAGKTDPNNKPADPNSNPTPPTDPSTPPKD